MSRPSTGVPSLRSKSNVDILKSPSNVNAESGAPVGLTLMEENDEFLRKWSGPMLLGGLLPAVFALISIIGGHIILNTWTGYCGYSLDSEYLVFSDIFLLTRPLGFISAALFVCYIYLLVYMWAFMGEKIYVRIYLTGLGFYLFKPFSSLKWLMIFYAVIWLISFIIWCTGTALLNLSIFCVSTSPELYQFSAYLVVTYWVGFFVCGCYLIKLKFGNLIERFVNDRAKGPSVQDMEEKIFRKEFKNFDKKKLGTIPQDVLSEFFVKVAVFVPEEELPGVLNQLGVSGDDEIEFNPLLQWFKDYNVRMAGYGGEGEEDDKEDRDDADSPKKPMLNKATSSASAKGK
jgi:hypothetical protein